MVTKSSREMQKDREKIRPPFGGLKFYQGTHYLPLTHCHTGQLSVSSIKISLPDFVYNQKQTG